MRAAVVAEKNAVAQTGTFADPEPASGMRIVEVFAGALGPTDLMRAAGFFGPMPYPYVPGGEGVGRLDDGTRVYFGHSHAPFGALAERTLVPEAEIWPIPDTVDDALAIALGTSGTGALIPLEEAKIQPGEHVLILGATGPLGQLASQIARILGAGKVTGAARNATALARMKTRNLVDDTVQLGQGDDFAALKAAAGNGYNVILDCIYGPPAEAALRTSASGARMMSIGIAAGPTVTISLRDLVFRSHIGVGTGQRPVSERRATYNRLIALAGQLQADTATFPLAQAHEAWTVQGQSPHGKIIVRPGV